MPDDDVLRIVYLEAENVKRLKAVRIRPDKTLVKIEGRNAQGKSSVLDAIAAALGGGKHSPDKPIREGTRKARVVVDLGELLIERRWTSTGTYLSVTSKDGSTLPSPQAVLDKLIGDLTFDPLAFVTMKPADQVSQLKRLVGLDFGELDTRRDTLFIERTSVKREAKQAEARTGAPVAQPANLEIVATSQLAIDYDKAVQHNTECETAVWKVQESNKECEYSAGLCERLRRELHQAEAAHEQGLIIRNVLADEAAAMKPIVTGNFAEQLKKVHAHNDAIRTYHAYRQQRAEADQLITKAEQLTSQIEAVDEQKYAMLQAAKFPLDGLSFDADGVSYNGIPLSQASSAEQLRIGVAIGLAQKPRARIMLCHNGSLLDNESLQRLHDVAEEFDAQVFVERVAEEASPSAVYIEDGEVVDDVPPIDNDGDVTVDEHLKRVLDGES